MFILKDVNTVGLNRINDIMNFKFQFDCGSAVHVLPTKDFRKIVNDNDLTQFKPSDQSHVMFQELRLCMDPKPLNNAL